MNYVIYQGFLNNETASLLYDSLPLFQPITAYIAGFVIVNKEYKDLSYTGVLPRTKFTVKSWNGAIKSGDLERIREKENLGSNNTISFEGIGKFSHSDDYLFNTGNLLWKKEDWNKYVINKL